MLVLRNGERPAQRNTRPEWNPNGPTKSKTGSP